MKKREMSTEKELANQLVQAINDLVFFVKDGNLYDREGNFRDNRSAYYIFPDNFDILDEERSKLLFENRVIRVITKEKVISLFPTGEYRVFSIYNIDFYEPSYYAEEINKRLQQLPSILEGKKSERKEN